MTDEHTMSVKVNHDPEVNAAALTFAPLESGRNVRDHSITDEDGDVIAIVSFESDGRLAQIQLLDASSQLPLQAEV